MKLSHKMLVPLFMVMTLMMAANCPDGNVSSMGMDLLVDKDGNLTEGAKEQLKGQIEKASGQVNLEQLKKGESVFGSTFDTGLLIKDGKSLDKYLKENQYKYVCDEGSDKEKADAVEDFARQYKDLDRYSHFAGVLGNLLAFHQIKDHEKQLRELPHHIVKDAILKGLGNKKKLIMPPGSRKVMEKIKQKYQKLEGIVAGLNELKKDPTSKKYEDRKKDMRTLLKEYKNIKLDSGEEKSLKEAGYKDDLAKHAINSGLSEVEAFVEKDYIDIASLEGQGDTQRDTKASQIETIKGYKEDIRKIKEQLKNEFAKTLYTQSNYRGDKGKDFKFYSKEDMAKKVAELQKTKRWKGADAEGKKDMLSALESEMFLAGIDQRIAESEEVTGWRFDLGEEVDIFKSIIKEQPEDKIEPIYAALKEGVNGLTEKPALRKNAVQFFNNYKAVQTSMDKDFYADHFKDQIKKFDDKIDLESSDVGNISMFKNYMYQACGKQKNCKFSDAMGTLYRDPETLKNLTKSFSAMLSGGNENLTPKDLAKINYNIWQAKQKLKDTYYACFAQAERKHNLNSLRIPTKDFINCSLLKGAISTSGFDDYCDEKRIGQFEEEARTGKAAAPKAGAGANADGKKAGKK